MKEIIAIVTTFIVICAIIVTASTFWGDWLIKEILNKDINNWLIAAAYLILCLATPEKLRGLPIFVMVVATLYVWFVK